MKIKLPLFCLLFLASNNLAFALEPSAELIAKVDEADLIIIGKPVEIKEVERIDYQLSDFKVKTPVWKCEKSVIPRVPVKLNTSINTQAETEGVAQWECCGEKKRIEIQDDGENSTMTTSSSETCATFNSPTGYLTGGFGRYYDIFLNGKKLSEEEYMNYELKQKQRAGRPKFVKKEITIQVERIIKGEEVPPKIIIDSEIGGMDRYEETSNYKYPFREKYPNERILFLRKIKNGHYSLVVYSAAQNATDMVINDGYITIEEDKERISVSAVSSEETVQSSSAEIPATEEIKTGKPTRISVDDYVAMINTAIVINAEKLKPWE